VKRIRFIFMLSLALLSVCLPIFTVNGAEEIVIKAGCVHNMEHPSNQGLAFFKKTVEEASKERITVKIFPAGQLGTEMDMIDQVKLGTLQIVITGRYENFCPSFCAMGLPFLFKNLDQVNKVIFGPIGKIYYKKAEEVNLKVLTCIHDGFCHFTNSRRPVKKPEDLAGLKLRTPPMEIVIQNIKALGANPTPVNFAELYMALKTNVVDAQVNNYANIVDGKIYEVQKYLTVCGFMYYWTPYLSSLKWWNSLSKKDQAIIASAADKAGRYTNKLQAKSDVEGLKFLKQHMTVNVLTANERKAFVEKTKPVYDWAIEKGYITQEIINRIKKL
jgi:tripartite ATP-independent transporter DctP family solute receptor